MTTIHVIYEQSRHSVQDVEAHTSTYSSYTDAVAAACTYFEGWGVSFPNELFELALEGARRVYTCDTAATLADVKTYLLEHADDVTVHGCICSVYLTLDGTTNYGKPILQCVTISIPALVEATAKAERSSVCNGCGDPDCDHDCGMLSCGCIDVCRGRC